MTSILNFAILFAVLVFLFSIDQGDGSDNASEEQHSGNKVAAHNSHQPKSPQQSVNGNSLKFALSLHQNYMTLHEDGLTARMISNNRGILRALKPFSPSLKVTIYYYQVKVIAISGKEPFVKIGLLIAYISGYSNVRFDYLSSGEAYLHNEQIKHSFPKFKANDVVGCGFLVRDEGQHIFITINGQFVYIDKENTSNAEADHQLLDQSDANLQFEGTVSSDESIDHYDIWANPKSPGAVSLPSALSGEMDADLNAKIESQLAIYKSGARPSRESDIFQWWRENSTKFPDLGRLAQIFLSIPATSISSERLFSKAGLLYANTLRNRLSGKMAEKILIIKANMDKLLLAPPIEPDENDLNLNETGSEDEED